MRYVIIGMGTAGVNAAEVIRRNDTEGEITIINNEEYRFYYRTSLKYYMKGMLTKQQMIARPEGTYEKLNIKVIDDNVVKIDKEKKELQLQNNDAIGYDKILIASGASPRKLGVPGEDLKNVMPFYTLNHTDMVNELKGTKKKAVVIGGGPIAAESAEMLKILNFDVTLMLRKEKVSFPRLDDEKAEMIHEIYKKNNIKVMFQEETAEFKDDIGNGEVTKIITKRGIEIPCDLCLICVGAIPNSKLAEGMGVECNHGILVDRFMQTNIEGVYSAGDVAQVCTDKRPHLVWEVAGRMGRTAGHNMAKGNIAEFKDCVVDFHMSLFGYQYHILGDGFPHDENECEILVSSEGTNYFRLVIKNNILIGAVMFGSAKNAGMIKKAIINHTDVSRVHDQLLDPNFDWKRIVDIG